MTYSPGVNCHLTLSHPDVDSGAAFGFLVNVDDQTKGEGIRVNREVLSDGTTLLWVYFDVILSSRMINPDGSLHADSKATMYSKLCQFLACTSGMTLVTQFAAYMNLGSLGFTADERHKGSISLIKVQLNNVGIYWPAVDPQSLELSVWDGTLTWETSYWR